MNLLKSKNIIIASFAACFSVQITLGQEGTLQVEQDPKIDKLLVLKKEINTSETSSDRYKIQVYSGGLSGAEKAESTAKSKFSELPTTLEFETPNYKVWTGNFRSRLEADRTLLKIQKEFKNAFVFKPKREKESE